MRKEAFIFFYLPSTTDLSHDKNQFGEIVSLHPIYCPYEDFRRYSEAGEDFIPTDLESRDLEKRTKAAKIVRKFFKNAAQVSTSNIIRNANNLLTTLQHDDNDITWIGSTKQRVDTGRRLWVLLVSCFFFHCNLYLFI